MEIQGVLVEVKEQKKKKNLAATVSFSCSLFFCEMFSRLARKYDEFPSDSLEINSLETGTASWVSI